MKKTLLKRFKIKRNKMLHLPAGQNHFRSKKKGKVIRQRRKTKGLAKEIVKKIKVKINR